jgi:hypothetical protein
MEYIVDVWLQVDSTEKADECIALMQETASDHGATVRGAWLNGPFDLSIQTQGEKE